MTMQTSGASPAKAHGRLSREVLARLGKKIEDYFNSIKEPAVPERFRVLLERLDEAEERVPEDKLGNC
jgi:hypothetical protein